MGSIGWTNVEFLRKKEVDARLVLFPKSIQFPLLKAFRKKSVFHYLGSDIRGKTPDELAYGKRADGEIVGSYDAIRWVPNAHVVPNGLDLSKYEPTAPPQNDPIRVVHAPTSRQKKGTDRIVEACEGLPVELDIVENTRHDLAIERYKQADIVVDQLNAGWYGVFALECMALGKPVLTYLHEEAVRRTEEAFGVELPLIPTSKDTLADDLQRLVDQPELRD